PQSPSGEQTNIVNGQDNNSVGGQTNNIVGSTLGYPSFQNNGSQSEQQQQVQLSCEWSQLPKTVPQNKIHELELMFNGGVCVFNSNRPGAPIDMLASGDAPAFAYLCRFSNLGSSSVLNFQTKLTIGFKGEVKEEGGVSRIGELTGSIQKIRTPRISLGSHDQ